MSAPHFLRVDFPEGDVEVAESKRILPFADSPLYRTTISKSRVLSQGPDVKTTYEITLDLKDIEHKFKPGDAIGILPNNNENEVFQLLERLQLTEFAEKFYRVSILEGTAKKKPAIPTHVPSVEKLKNVFLQHLDIRSVPKKLFLKTLVEYTKSDEDKVKLGTLCDPKQSEAYQRFISQEGRTLLTTLQYLPSCVPSIERLFEHLPPLQPRYYSVASSPALPRELSVAFSVLDFGEFKGVCTGWLENCVHSPGANVPFYFRRSGDFLSTDIAAPVILVGPGTGVAPFIGFLQDRNLKQERGEIVLYFGCRYPDRDHIYKEEMEGFVNAGVLKKLSTAYSRETRDKLYVQDNILIDSTEIAEYILNKNATVCVCGDAKNMVAEVERAIISCVGNEEIIKEMKKANKYQVDNWI